MEHNWIKNFTNQKGHKIIVCSCGKEFKGYDEETAQKGFFQHKEKSENTKK